MNNRNNENLRNQVASYTNMLNKLQRNKAMPNYQKYYTNAIAAITRELNRRAKARAQGHWKKVHGGATALSVVNYWHKRTHRAPGPGNVGGAAYRRLAGQTTYRRRSVSRSRSPRRRSPNKRSPGRSPRR